MREAMANAASLRGLLWALGLEPMPASMLPRAKEATNGDT